MAHLKVQSAASVNRVMLELLPVGLTNLEYALLSGYMLLGAATIPIGVVWLIDTLYEGHMAKKKKKRERQKLYG